MVKISGYGAVWGVQIYDFVLARGCYSKAIAEHKANGTAPLMLLAHDPDRVLGKWTSFEEDSKGLRVVGALNLALPGAREVFFAVRRGDLKGLSVGNAGVPNPCGCTAYAAPVLNSS